MRKHLNTRKLGKQRQVNAICLQDRPLLHKHLASHECARLAGAQIPEVVERRVGRWPERSISHERRPHDAASTSRNDRDAVSTALR